MVIKKRRANAAAKTSNTTAQATATNHPRLIGAKVKRNRKVSTLFATDFFA